MERDDSNYVGLGPARRSIVARLTPAILIVALVPGLSPGQTGPGTAGVGPPGGGQPAGTGAGASDGTPRHKDVDAAVEKFQAGKLDEARQLLLDAKKKNPELPPGNLMFAQLLFAANQPAAARSAVEQAVADEPKDPEGYLILGDLAFQQQRLTDADLLFSQAFTLTGEYKGNAERQENLLMRSYAGVAAVAEARQQWAAAESQLRAWLKLNPENVVALTRLARTLFKQGQEKEAYKVLQDLYGINAQAGRPEINMAGLFEQAGKRPNARKLVELAVQRDAESSQTRLAAANWALEAGELDMAATNTAEALRLVPKSFEARLMSGLVNRYKRKYAEAEEPLVAAHLQMPLHPAAINQLALVLIEQPDEEKRGLAAQYAEMNARLNSDQAQPVGREAAVTLGWVLMRLGRVVEAERAVQAALSSGSVSADAAFHAASLFHTRGRDDLARPLLKPILDSTVAFPSREDAEKLLASLKLE